MDIGMQQELQLLSIRTSDMQAAPITCTMTPIAMVDLLRHAGLWTQTLLQHRHLKTLTAMATAITDRASIQPRACHLRAHGVVLAVENGPIRMSPSHDL